MWGDVQGADQGTLIEMGEDQTAAMSIEIQQAFFQRFPKDRSRRAGFGGLDDVHCPNGEPVSGDAVPDHLAQKRQGQPASSSVSAVAHAFFPVAGGYPVEDIRPSTDGIRIAVLDKPDGVDARYPRRPPSTRSREAA